MDTNALYFMQHKSSDDVIGMEWTDKRIADHFFSEGEGSSFTFVPLQTCNSQSENSSP